jgi:hypothetical protein
MWILDGDDDATNVPEQIDVFKSVGDFDPPGRYPTRADFALPQLPNCFADSPRRAAHMILRRRKLE